MKSVITKIILVGLAVACITVIAFPSIMSDGKKVKDRTTNHYQQMFQ